MTQNFDKILFEIETNIAAYDLTNAVQVMLDVRIFNRKLGIFKRDDNITLGADKLGDGSNVWYDVSNNWFTTADTTDPSQNYPYDVSINSITLTADEFRTALVDASQVMSVGYYSSVYSDFMDYVEAYFGYAGGFATLFESTQKFNINNGVFDGSAFVNLINASASPDGAFTTDISGAISINNVTENLRFAIDSNCFNNRDACANALPDGTSTDVSNPSNYGVQDGFIDGDIVWIPAGTAVQLSVGVDSEAVSSIINNLGPSQAHAFLATNGGSNYTQSGAIFSAQSSASLNNISRVLTAPLVIVLKNLSSTALTS